GPSISVRKRYSDFCDLREELVKRYPRLKTSIPKLPPKKVVGKFTPAFVEQRRRDLEYFFKYVVLHPTLGSSATVTHWIAP
ncbi:Phox homologous domain-containing protein, partial [Zychaea mexicana]|uniref:PX domain-containing protein n=1 Tax=Zychaea mexicana TaxID=64656 RepID=UPI0022FE7622